MAIPSLYKHLTYLHLFAPKYHFCLWTYTLLYTFQTFGSFHLPQYSYHLHASSTTTARTHTLRTTTTLSRPLVQLPQIPRTQRRPKRPLWSNSGFRWWWWWCWDIALQHHRGKGSRSRTCDVGFAITGWDILQPCAQATIVIVSSMSRSMSRRAAAPSSYTNQLI